MWFKAFVPCTIMRSVLSLMIHPRPADFDSFLQAALEWHRKDGSGDSSLPSGGTEMCLLSVVWAMSQSRAFCTDFVMVSAVEEF